jgi:hypothetical protein
MYLLRAVFLACTVMLTVVAQEALAGSLVYEFKEYPAIQNGYTISGTITVNDNALASGLLTVSDIMAMSITVTKDGVTYTSVGNADIPFTVIERVHIDANEIYLQALNPTATATFGTHSGTGGLGGVTWFQSTFKFAGDSLSVKGDDGVLIIDDSFTDLAGSPYVIAELQTPAVPEPSSLVLGLVAAGGLGIWAAWRRKSVRSKDWPLAEE